MKKGFTLIELLAVIVILAIIVVIVTPIILNIIESSQQGADKRSIEQYAKVLKESYLEQKLDDSSLTLDDYLNNTLLIASVQYDGDRIECEEIKGSENNDVQINLYNCTINGRKYYNYIDGEMSKVPEKLDDNLIQDDKENVIVENEVYFDVSKGVGCTKEEYESSYDEEINDFLNSKTGYNGLETTKTSDLQNSCLKFYSFNDDGGDTINLLLDHNTTAAVAWTDQNTKTSENGPIDVITQLKNDTDQWNIELTLETYEYNSTISSYKISYNKARLITAQEIAEIVGIGWYENSSAEMFFFNSEAPETPCYGSKCEYGWLYDRTSKNCTDSGCLNNSDLEMTNYWTASAFAAQGELAWVVSSGYVSNGEVNKSSAIGIRPVITIQKSI